MKRLALKPLPVEFSGLVDAFLFARGSSSREADDSAKCKETGAEVGTSKERPFAVSTLLERERLIIKICSKTECPILKMSST